MTHTHGHTHTQSDRQTYGWMDGWMDRQKKKQATTLPGSQNWPRVKKMSLCLQLTYTCFKTIYQIFFIVQCHFGLISVWITWQLVFNTSLHHVCIVVLARKTTSVSSLFRIFSSFVHRSVHGPLWFPWQVAPCAVEQSSHLPTGCMMGKKHGRHPKEIFTLILILTRTLAFWNTPCCPILGIHIRSQVKKKKSDPKTKLQI